MKISRKTILIVDDDASIRMLSRKILETSGCVIHEASSVRDALYQIQTHLPDLVILDLSMPEHDGFIFLKARLQNRRMMSIPVLVLSVSTKKNVMEKALALGANQFLEKPLKANLLLQKVRLLFYSQEHASYQFSKGEEPAITAEINGLITGHAENQLKISSIAKFDRGKPLQIKLEHYIQSGGSTVVARVDNRKIDVDQGLYGQILTVVGLSKEEKEKLQEWQKKC